MANEIKKNEFTTAVATVVQAYLPSIENQLRSHNIELDDYQKECGINCISSLNELILNSKLSGWNDESLDKSNLQDVIKKVALYKLNSFATNREVYFQIENVNRNGKWVKRVIAQLEGDGHDALLRNFGVNVKKVHPFWAVRENDEFEYGKHVGIETTPPIWKPKGEGKIVRVVYPIELTDGSVEYRIAERENVVNNLIAHITNNMKNETFGICSDRYQATPQQLDQIEKKKKSIKEQLKGKSLDELLDFELVQQWISPAWREPHSREAMILRKMRNNAISKFPKDFGSAYAERTYHELTDETSFTVASDIKDNANKGNVIDVEFTEEVEPIEESKSKVKVVNNAIDIDVSALNDEPDFLK